MGFLSSFLFICLMFLFSLQMPVRGTEQFVVLGPTEPIVALLGTDIILPCRLSPFMSAEHMEVRWFRSQFSEAVFVFQKGKEETDEQLVEYTGRTELISEFITEGRLAVKIYNVQISDNGKYQCYFRKGDVYEQASLEVKVAGLGSAPHLRLEGHEDGGVKLACMADGWFPQPQVQWRDNRGRKLSSLSETQAQDEAGFFHMKALIVVQESSVRNVSCSICNKLLSQEKISAIDIPESFFPKTSPWKKALSGILPVVGILLGISIFFILKERKKTKKLLQEKKDDKKDKGSSWPLSHAFSCTCIDLVPLSAVNVTLDPASAHPGLVLSRNGKDTKVESARTSAEETFSVLGQKSITSGRHYWEVKVEMEVGNKATWHLGICRDSASRSGWVRESPEKGFWAVGCSDGIFQPMFSKQSVAPSLGKPPEQIGIFLDCEAGDVSFYNMTDGSHIYNFPPESFSGPVCPYFSIQTLDTSFTICGVSDRPESIPAPSLETPGTAQEQEKFLGDKNKALEEESTPTQISMFGALRKMMGFLRSFLSRCLISLLILQMTVCVSEQFKVLGPTGPIVAILDTDVTLPCRLSPLMNAEHMDIRWLRSQFYEAVFVFQNGREQVGEQLVEYMGRTEFISDFIKEGRVAVKIYNVKMSDNGEYQCIFQEGDAYEKAVFEVKVASLGSAPRFHLEGYEDGGIRLVCSADGWFPQPQVQCRDNRGGKLFFLSETQAQDEAGFFHVKTLIVVQDSSVRNISCSIYNPLLGQGKVSTIDISEPFFPKTSPWKKALIGIIPVMVIFLGISIFFILKERKKTKKLLQEKEEEQKYKDNLRTELEKRKHLYDSAWRKAHIYVDWRKQHFQALNVTLDPASAHPGLVLSRNGKVMRVKNARKIKEEKFSVLGQKSITSGRYYWEVKVEMEVGNKVTWQLGICRNSASRSGWFRESPEKGFWAVGCSEGIFQPMFSKQSVAPSLGKPPEQIGIFLDYEAGDVSFYNMTDGSHIYNFPPDSFSGPVRPYFSIQTLDTSFTICGVSDRPESIPAPSLETPGTAQEQEKFLGDKNKALEEESTPTQSHSPPHYKPVSQHTK
ncbi:uncharacterized protein LOC100025825 [Monodelphis domestica]|uniref:uncharacterized protein LOC100025825 n=1 Tax=Monodelphis domestica TaxID=13616 RepID=UPI0024E1D3D8|nr:uncharacterized protein LOC100025825 [Monodelphis domestica]